VLNEEVVSRTSKWGWGILVVLAILLVLNGVALYFISAWPSTFEQDTGVSMSEVRQTFPTVVDQVVRGGQTTSILLAGFGLLALVVAVEGFRHASRWAWNAMWILVAMMAVVGVRATVMGQVFGLYYLVIGAVALVGQLLARRGWRPDRKRGEMANRESE
jgi:lysylphosphatidylglycerol synthetase-like protein (DUF2156 family)